MRAIPQTLLQLTHAQSSPCALDRSVAIIVDAQVEYVSGKLPLTGVDEALAETAALLDLARRQTIPVFHVVQHSPPGRGLFESDGPFVALAPAAAPLPEETLLKKRLPNAFAGTPLHQLIQATGKTELILAGFMTHMCVSATAMAALDLGYKTTLVAAATATRDLPDLDGGVIPAETVQRAALAALADRFATIVADTTAL